MDGEKADYGCQSFFLLGEGVGERTGIESQSEKVAFLWRMKS